MSTLSWRALLSEAWRDCLSGTARVGMLTILVTALVGGIICADAFSLRSVSVEAASFRVHLGSVRVLQAQGSIDGATCDALSRIPGVRAGAVRSVESGLSPLALPASSLPLLARGMSRAQADVEANQLLDAFNLAHLATRPFRDLSGGEAQRVLLARGLACAPTLLLVDEPTAQLDQSTARDIASTLGSLREDGVSVVIATHDPSIRAQCDAIIDLACFQDEEGQQ